MLLLVLLFFLFIHSFYRHLPYPDRIHGSDIMGWLWRSYTVFAIENCIQKYNINIRVELKRSIKSIWCSGNHITKKKKNHERITWLHEHKSKCAISVNLYVWWTKKDKTKQNKKSCNFCTDLFAFLIGFFSSASDKSHKYETVCPFI